jgi:CubicO group peptidase (beta-lactamase class C family)
MRNDSLRILLITIIGSLFAFSITLFVPKFHTLGNDFTPPVPVFNSVRIPNDFINEKEFGFIDDQMQKFINKWGIAGASVAIAKDDRMVFAKAFGYADKENLLKAEPYHLFRVASVSKLVTAVGIMKMVENGMISLESNVFGPDGILNDSTFLNYIDKRVEKITVKQLLEHSAGWTNRYGDHMFMPTVIAQKLKKKLPIDENDIIRFALAHKLHFEPGSFSSYSNLGYAVLGKVIEKVSGMGYEEYIKSSVLFPLGIYDMCIGGSHLYERKELEVKYYESDNSILVEDYTGTGNLVPRSYGGNDIKCLGAAGGWIASSTDLMRLMLAINGNPKFKDILYNESIEQMVINENLQKSPLGWRRVNEREWVRTGTLASTSALMVHRHDGISYVIVINTGSWKGADFTLEMERSMNKIVQSISHWPEYDLLQLDLAIMQPIEKRNTIVF